MTTPSQPAPTSIDVRDLPDVAFGHRDLVWWGTVGFMVIEGFTLLVCAAVWVYLAQNMSAWPPEGVPRPSIVAPTVQVVLMLLSLPLMWWQCRAARTFDFERVRLAVTLAAVASGVFVALRFVELLDSLNVRWDTNAYGSAQWLVVGAHGTLLLMMFLEMTGIAVAFWFADLEAKHFSDADDAAYYWQFVVLAWVPLYLLCFVLPQFI